MSLDGTYGFVYSGVNGIGIGVFVIKDGTVTGRDWANTSYSGSAMENADSTITMDLRLRFPPGTYLVQGSSPQDLAHEREFKVTVPARFGEGAPFKAHLPGGSMHMMVQRTTQDYAPAASKGFRMELGR